MSGGARGTPCPVIRPDLPLPFQAAGTAPAIVMRRNRRSDIDRDRAMADDATNIRAKAGTAPLHGRTGPPRGRGSPEAAQPLAAAPPRIDEKEGRGRPA